MNNISPSSEPVSDVRVRPIPVSELPAKAFSGRRMICFFDCDPAGIVFTPHFVTILNGVIEDLFLGALGLNYHALIRDDRIGLGYAHINCDFFLPAQMSDQMVFTPLVKRIGRSSVGFLVHGHRGADEVVRGNFVMVTTSIETYRPISLPKPIRTALVAYEKICR